MLVFKEGIIVNDNPRPLPERFESLGGRSEVEMKYLCLVYAEPEIWEKMSRSESEQFDRECREYDEDLRKKGYLILAQPLESAHTAMTVRIRGGKTSTVDGPFAETKEHLCGFVLIEAKDLNLALGIASRSPFARWGSVEVRPALEPVKPAFVR